MNQELKIVVIAWLKRIIKVPKWTFNSRWAKIPVTVSYRWKPEHWKLHVATPLMASKSKVSTPVSQPDISNYIQRQRTNSNKRLLSSPTDNQLNKKAIMEVMTEVKDNHWTDKFINLPPDLKLLYDSLSVRLDSIDWKIDPNLSSRVEHVETKQLKLAL